MVTCVTFNHAPKETRLWFRAETEPVSDVWIGGFSQMSHLNLSLLVSLLNSTHGYFNLHVIFRISVLHNSREQWAHIHSGNSVIYSTGLHSSLPVSPLCSVCFGTAATPKPVSSHTNTGGSDKGWCCVLLTEPVRFSRSNPVKREWKQMHLENYCKHGLCSANKIKACACYMLLSTLLYMWQYFCSIKTLFGWWCWQLPLFLCVFWSHCWCVCQPGFSAAQTLRPPAETLQFVTLLHDGFFVNTCRSGSIYCGVGWAFRIMWRIMTVWANVLKGKVYLQLELFLETEIKLSTFIIWCLPFYLHFYFSQIWKEAEE